MPPVIAVVAAVLEAGAVAVGVSATSAAFAAFTVFAAQTLVYGALTYGLGKISQALTKKANTSPLNSAQARQLTFRQAAAPRACIYGRQLVGGIITFANVNGTVLDIVITIAGHEIEAIDNIYFDAEEVTFSGGAATGRFAGYAEMESNLGSDSQAAFPNLVADLPSLWTSNHRQRGCAGVHFKLTSSTTLYPGGLPNITFNVRGKKVYDPATTLTTYNNNAALCIADFLVDTRFGLGCDYATEINDTVLLSASNTCDEAVQIGTSPDVYENRYTIDGKFDSSEDPGTILEQMAGAMAGYVIFTAGKWQILPGAFRSSVLTLADADIVAPAQIQTKRSLRDLFNTVKGTYIDPNRSWQETSFPEVTSATYVTADGGTKIYKAISLPFTVSGTMAQRIAKIDLERNRRQVTCQLTANMNLYKAQPGNVVAWTHSRFSWTAKTFEVASMGLTPITDDTGGQALAIASTLNEVDVDVYGFTVGDYGTTITPTEVTLSIGPLTAPDTWNLTANFGGELRLGYYYASGEFVDYAKVMALVDYESRRSGPSATTDASFLVGAASIHVDTGEAFVVGDTIQYYKSSTGDSELMVITGITFDSGSSGPATIDVDRGSLSSTAIAGASGDPVYVLNWASLEFNFGTEETESRIKPGRMRIVFAEVTFGLAGRLSEASNELYDSFVSDHYTWYGSLPGLRVSDGIHLSMAVNGAVLPGDDVSPLLTMPNPSTIGVVYAALTMDETDPFVNAPQGQSILGQILVDDQTTGGFSAFSQVFEIEAGTLGTGIFLSGAQAGNVGNRVLKLFISQVGTTYGGSTLANAILTAVISAAGSGYINGSLVTVSTGGVDAQFVVITDPFLGTVIYIIPFYPGTGYSTGVKATTVAGPGSGLTIDVTSVGTYTWGVSGDPAPGRNLTLRIET